MSDPKNSIDQLLEESEASLRSGQSRKALASLFRLLGLDPCHGRALQASARIMATLNDVKGAEILESLAEDPEEPNRLYLAGFHLITMGRPDVAKSFLEACLRKVGSHPDVLYELGFCHFRDGNYTRAVNLLKKAVPNLTPERAVGAELLLIENLLYAGSIEEGLNLLERAGEEYRSWGRGDSVQALELMYARYRKIDSPQPWDLRTWHYVRHGSLLLSQSKRGKPSGIFDALSMNYLAVAGMLRILKSIVEGLEIRLNHLLHLDRSSRILALALGRLLDKPVLAWKDRSDADAMLVIPDMTALETAAELPIDREVCTTIFCFQVFPLQQYALLPEIVGLLANRFRFPWEERVEIINREKGSPQARNVPADPRDPEAIATEIVEAAQLLPEYDQAPELISFYQAHRDLLLYGNPDRFPQRRHFDPRCPG